MKIICIGRNYSDHVKELNSETPSEPVYFLKPDSSLLINNKPFFLPGFSKEMHHELEVVLQISRLGKNIDRKFAHRYYNKLTLGIDFTARDLQRECIKKGLPWEISKGFDNSAVVGSFIDIDVITDKSSINFYLEKNGIKVQEGNTSNMIFSFDKIISYVSGYMTLKTGDLIFTGTPSGIGEVQVNDHLTAFLEGRNVLDFYVR